MTDTPPPPAPAPAPYGSAPYGAPLGPRTNSIAIVALILGLTVPIGGIIAGHIALGQIKRTGEAGHGLAQAGLILGYVFTALGLLVAIGYIIAIAFAVTAGVTSGVSPY